MKKILLLILIFFSANCFAQNKTIDSLKQLLKEAKEDAHRVWILHLLSGMYTWSFADTAILYAQQELELSQRLNFNQGIAVSSYDLGGALTTIGNYTNALTYLYKALLLFQNLKDSSTIIDPKI